MNNKIEVEGALASDFISFRQPRLKVLTQAQADLWAARQEAGYIGIGASFEAVGYTDGFVRVAEVGSDTTAEDAGIKSGDRIAAINGKALINLPIGVVRLLLSGNPGEKLVLQQPQRDRCYLSRLPDCRYPGHRRQH